MSSLQALICMTPTLRTHLGRTLLLMAVALPATGRSAPLSYYLPKGVKYSSKITTPKQFLRFEIGDRHLQHHQLVSYLRLLAKTSDRIKIQEYARTHGQRPLVMLTITSPDNHQRWSEIQANHLKLAQPDKSADVELEKLPAVINMGYSVHGNEASAGNAAALVGYHLAAAQGEEIDRLLDNVVILVDPCLNPDGFDRFAHWVNANRGRLPSADPAHREHNESWPNGRTNYYWFDLNRDWLPLVHPESRGRLRLYHQVKPNVVLDFHEMGSNTSFFFQPGVPTRNHPLTPSNTFALTKEMGDYHARALDKVGSLYFTEERFDDFYMGKGSTYPDLHGAVGILFEQGSARGQRQRTTNGLLTFSFTVRNQFLTSMSSLRATLEMRRKLLEHKRDFYKGSLELAKKNKVKAVVLTAPHDPARLHALARILQQHDIRVQTLSADVEHNGKRFPKGQSILVPIAQPEYRFLLALFEKRTEFQENIFYDVSTWTLPLAFNLQYAELEKLPPANQWADAYDAKFPGKNWKAGQDDLAYLIDWRGYYAPRTLARLMARGVICKVARSPFRATPDGPEHPYGTIVVPLGIQKKKSALIQEMLVEAAAKDGVQIDTLKTSLTPGGIDLGSSGFQTIQRPKVLLVVGDGVRAYEAGETWHLLDQRFGIATTLIEASRLSSLRLSDYTTVILVSGNYGGIEAETQEELRRWIKSGGVLLGIASAAEWLNSAEFTDVALKPMGSFTANRGRRPYAARTKESALQLISGAIFATSVDTTHPIGYGFTADKPGEPWATVPVFRNNRVVLRRSTSSRRNPSVYLSEPLLSGYVSPSNLRNLSSSASVEVHRSGSGSIIIYAENPNFRGFWYGTNRLFLNGLFFGDTIR